VNTFRRTRSPAPESPGAVNNWTRLRINAAADQAGERYLQVRKILLGYLSPILVDSVLDRALDARLLTPASLDATALGEVTADILVGLRLFVPPTRLPDLMVELAGVLDPEAP
jgi:hypothetical protein